MLRGGSGGRRSVRGLPVSAAVALLKANSMSESNGSPKPSRPQHISDANHPIWSLARMALAVVAILGVLGFTASNFDKTEIIATIVIIAILSAGEGAIHKVIDRYFKRNKDG